MKELQRHFGKAAAVMDRASPHRAKAVKRLLRENKSIKIIYLPKESPYLNAVEECWRQRKQVLLVSEYYRTFADLCNAIITYYRTVRFKLDIFKFAHRKATALHELMIDAIEVHMTRRELRPLLESNFIP